MKTILVDDMLLDLQLFELKCADMPDFEIVGKFTDPNAAIEYAAGHVVDFALLDIDMPGMDGIHLAQALRRLRSDIIIVFATAHPKFAVEALKMKADYIIFKPFDREDIADVMERAKLLRRRQCKRIHFHTFGAFDMLVDGEPVHFRSGKAKELMALCVYRDGRPVSIHEIVENLWGENADGTGYRRTIKELAEKMKMQPSVIVKKLFLQGTVVTINQEVDYDKAEEIAMEFDILCEKEEKVDVIEELLREDEEDEKDMTERPPVVCVMGHVDHGKTSLLDAIRQTHVTAKEAGGITQHIGAYVVEKNGQRITFLDTPGHEAFTAMRMRGAKSTDIAILVVAADDGVMPQTVEAINHAKAAGVEIIVAVNKIDKPSANVEKVKQELIEYELVAEDWGGSTVFVPVSAHTGEGIEELLEMILLTSEVKELKANPNRRARGLIIEAELDKGKGPVATVLVQKGTLHVGDPVACGSCYGKVRAMMARDAA